GLAEVPTGTPWPLTAPSPMAITAIRRQGASETSATVPAPAGGIELRYREWLSLELAVLDLSPERHHRYEYRLSEQDPWISLGHRRELTFVELEPGVHALEVRGRNSRGAWSSLPTPLAIRVIPPFWMSAWFRVL